jgi:hypothetical protein
MRFSRRRAFSASIIAAADGWFCNPPADPDDDDYGWSCTFPVSISYIVGFSVLNGKQ